MTERAWWCRECEDYVEAVERHRCFGRYCPNGCEGSCDSVPDVRPLRSRVAKLEAVVAAAAPMVAAMRRTVALGTGLGLEWANEEQMGLAAYDAAMAELEREQGGHET